MFEKKGLLYLYLESSLHAGGGRSLGAVDLPIQRERLTGYPFIQAGGVKGRLRAEAELSGKLTATDILSLFGPDTTNADAHAGALSTGDAHLVLFPVRSLSGVFAWVASLDSLARFQRLAVLAGIAINWQLPDLPPDDDTCWVNGSELVIGAELPEDQRSVVLEEYSFKPSQSQATLVKTIGEWLGEHALLQTTEYEYWKAKLPRKLCIVSENAFRDFANYSTEVQTHIRMDYQKKTGKYGARWTSESLPGDALLVAPILATKSRNPADGKTASEVIEAFSGFVTQTPRCNFGGDETTGQGLVPLRFESQAQ
jgi:CRISPR-associated protein Cmr4